MMFSKGKVFALCLALLPAAAQSATVELTKDADWTEFRFDITRESGAWLETNDNLGILSFTFSLTKSAYLQVSDGYRSGDQFEVFSNGSSLGFTSTPTAVGDEAGNDFNTAKMDARWSSGEWLLGPGENARSVVRHDELGSVRHNGRLLDSSDSRHHIRSNCCGNGADL